MEQDALGQAARREADSGLDRQRERGIENAHEAALRERAGDDVDHVLAGCGDEREGGDDVDPERRRAHRPFSSKSAATRPSKARANDAASKSGEPRAAPRRARAVRLISGWRASASVASNARSTSGNAQSAQLAAVSTLAATREANVSP